MRLYVLPLQLLTFAAVATSCARPIPAQVPDTPAGRQLGAWLEAFNSGDRERIREFLTSNYPTRNVDGEIAFRAQTGGFELRAVEQASPTSVIGLVQERDGDTFARFTIVVEPAAPHRITSMGLGVVPRPAEFAVPRMTEPELIAALREKLDKDVAADRFAGTVLLARIENGTARVLFDGAYGAADRDRNVANTLDTRFRIGSMNKMFTATAILQLVQAGKIALTDPLGKYIPDYPNQNLASKVTIHHLLTHTGGTGDIFGPEYSSRRLELRTLNDYIALYGNRDVAFEPGSRWAYSNYGMVLLGAVIERVSGQSYYEYVAENIYRPAGLTRTGSDPEDGGQYAYGFQDARRDGVGYVGHGGGAPGMNGDLRIYPGTGTVVAVLANMDPPAAARVALFLDLRLPR